MYPIDSRVDKLANEAAKKASEFLLDPVVLVARLKVCSDDSSLESFCHSQ